MLHSVAHSPLESNNLECQLRLLTSENSRLLTELTDLRKLYDADAVRHAKEIEKYQMRYERLQEDHSKLNQLNQELESKIITVIQTAESEKQGSAIRAQVAEEKLEKAEALIKQLTVECAKYKNDCQIVAQLLHTNPDNFLQPNSDLGEHGLEAPSGREGKVERTPSGHTKPLLDKQDAESPQYILPTFPPIALPPESSLFVHRQKVFTDSAVSASNAETPATSKMGGVFQI
ncbi:Golgi organization [Sparganum proliferum]